MEQRHRMTTKKLEELRRRNEAGENDWMIADALGISWNIVRYWRKKLGLPPRSPRRYNNGYVNYHQQVIYTVWDAKTDELIACGTDQECADRMGLANRQTFQQLASRAINGKNRKYYVEKAVENNG